MVRRFFTNYLRSTFLPKMLSDQVPSALGGGLFLLGAFDVFAGLGIDDDVVVLVDEQRGVDCGAGIERDLLGAAGGGVTTNRWRGLDDGKLHLDRERDIDDRIVPVQSIQHGVGFQKASGIAKQVGGKLEALGCIFGVGEPEFVAVIIEKFNLFAHDIRFFEYIGLREISLQVLSGEQIAELRLHDRSALLHLEVMRLQDHAGLVLVDEVRFWF